MLLGTVSCVQTPQRHSRPKETQADLLSQNAHDGGGGDVGSNPTSDGQPPTTGEAGVSFDAAVGSDAGGSDAGGSGPFPTKLPTVHGPCPTFQTGSVTFQFKNGSSSARLWIGKNPGNGPLVFYFHGTGMSPDDAKWSLGQSVIDDILAQGGVVLSPKGHGQYAWYIADGDTREDDLWLIDEMVACAIQEAKIDPRRIHATGLSSGATLTSDMVHRRAYYLASASPKSGGFDPYNPVPKNADPSNKMGVLIFHGGASDTWGNPAYEFYQEQSEKMAGILKQEGSFATVCNHGKGHTEPTWDQGTVWQFFKDHPFNVTPKPYANGLPANFPSYCKIW